MSSFKEYVHRHWDKVVRPMEEQQQYLAKYMVCQDNCPYFHDCSQGPAACLKHLQEKWLELEVSCDASFQQLVRLIQQDPSKSWINMRCDECPMCGHHPTKSCRTVMLEARAVAAHEQDVFKEDVDTEKFRVYVDTCRQDCTSVANIEALSSTLECDGCPLHSRCSQICPETGDQRKAQCRRMLETFYNTPEGTKHDDGKLDWSLMPWKQMEEVVHVLMSGAKKYGRENWKSVDRERYKSALMRHVLSYMSGEKTDKDDNLSTLAHIVCNCLFLEYFDYE